MTTFEILDVLRLSNGQKRALSLAVAGHLRVPPLTELPATIECESGQTLSVTIVKDRVTGPHDPTRDYFIIREHLPISAGDLLVIEATSE